MALHVTNNEITSDVTEHCAHRTNEGWEVSWLPDRVFDRNCVVTAMLLTELYVTDPPPWDRLWLLAAQWEREIGIDRRRDWL
ncbi:hypothetical protein [Amycolatopsis pithecellobii]|uniref:Uncharacterized protein n=1 Tax=Amycolatopsis pithecellobii TaxID=664692 RepID=A0A6N7Z438_9PSEU|nr:hypothetical protein [Amycolatopsis pithecellobii]MTD53876.1 hypothetical protein [Amycolatopsis pithecellobii]